MPHPESRDGATAGINIATSFHSVLDTPIVQFCHMGNVPWVAGCLGMASGLQKTATKLDNCLQSSASANKNLPRYSKLKKMSERRPCMQNSVKIERQKIICRKNGDQLVDRATSEKVLQKVQNEILRVKFTRTRREKPKIRRSWQDTVIKPEKTLLWSTWFKLTWRDQQSVPLSDFRTFNVPIFEN